MRVAVGWLLYILWQSPLVSCPSAVLPLVTDYISALCTSLEDVLVKLNIGLLWLKLHSTRIGIFLVAIQLGIEEEASEVLRLEHSFFGAET